MNEKIKKSAHKEFDDLFTKKIEKGYVDYDGTDSETELRIYEPIEMQKDIKSFIDSLIDKTVQSERELIVAKINLMELSGKPEGYELAIDELISLITNKSDININL